MQESSVEVFCLTVGLGVAYRSEMLFDAKVCAPSFKGVLGKLPSIIRDDDLRYAEAADDAFPKEFLNCQPGDGPQWLGFNPFGEVIHSGYQEGMTPDGSGERTYDVCPPLLEWPG